MWPLDNLVPHASGASQAGRGARNLRADLVGICDIDYSSSTLYMKVTCLQARPKVQKQSTYESINYIESKGFGATMSLYTSFTSY